MSRFHSILVLLAAMVAEGACAEPLHTTASTQPVTSSSEEIRTLVRVINDHRRQIGCKPLVWNAKVALVAQEHSDDMVRRHYFSHNTPEGKTSGQRADAAGIKWTRIAENIAAGQQTARAVYASWMNSPGHRANIDNCALREHGVGLTRGSPPRVYGAVTNAWTHDFVTLR